MRTTNKLPSVCKYCRHYSHQGRREGFCQKLSAPVGGNWHACSLAKSPFLPTWETLETLPLLESSSLETVQPIPQTSSYSEVTVEVTFEESQRSQTLVNN